MGISRREDCPIPTCPDCDCWKSFEQRGEYGLLYCDHLRQYKHRKNPPVLNGNGGIELASELPQSGLKAA